jgi:DNA-binding MarR family transcriptional regulator
MSIVKEHFHKCLLFSSAALARALARIAEEHFHAFDLSTTQGFILIAARKAPGISVSDLANLLALSTSTITKTLDIMVLKGLVQRHTQGKTVMVFLTGNGEAKEPDARSAWSKTRSTYNRAIGEALSRQVAEGSKEALVKLQET